VSFLSGERSERLAEQLAVAETRLAVRALCARLALLDGNLVGAMRATRVVHQQAMRDAEQPGREGALGVVAIPRTVDAQEQLLVEVLRALGRAGALRKNAYARGS
jgi:hypothetical protein